MDITSPETITEAKEVLGSTEVETRRKKKGGGRGRPRKDEPI
jgi:hypothetical protein